MEGNSNLEELESRVVTYITPAQTGNFSEILSCNVPHPDVMKIMSAANHILFTDSEDSWNEIRQKCGSAIAFINLIIRTQNEKVQIGNDKITKVEQILAENPGLKNLRFVSLAADSLFKWVSDYIKILKIRSMPAN